jgi:hypothetical protein
MGENVETGDFGKSGQASENLCIRYHVLQRKRGHGRLWEIWASNGKCSTTGTLPRITAETPENDLTMGENVETGYYGKKRASIGKLVR